MLEQLNHIKRHKISHLGKYNFQDDDQEINMKIQLIGLGFVGLSLTSVLAAKGNDILGIDIDKNKCENILISYYFQ